MRSREALVNMFNVKNDLFAQKQVDDTTQTRFGVLLSFVVLPSCLILYSCLWFVTFYLGLGAGSPPTYKVITTETLQFGNSIFPLTLKCSSYEGCFFRLPGNAVQTCAATSLVDGDVSSDFCSSNPSNPSGRRLAGMESSFMDVIDPGRKLLTVTPARCTSLVSCGTEMSAADGVCAFAPPGADPTDALTVQWKWTSSCSGGCNFGVKLITDYLDSKGEVTQKEIKVHRGMTLLNLVERDDPRMKWSSSHPNYAANKKKTKMYEWSVTPVDIDGVVDSQSNLCYGDLVTAFGTTGATVNAKRVKFVPSPTYSKMTTTYPSPGLTYLSAIGGISSVIMAICGVLHSFHLSLFMKKNAPAPAAV